MRGWTIALALVGASCGSPPAIECTETQPCPNITEICQAGQCVEVGCSTSSQCPIESYCDGGSCYRGCREDFDCYPGNHCEITEGTSGTCVEDACTDTKVDCGFREFCNLATGDCYDAGEKYCRKCDDNADCDDGNLCLNQACGVDCSGGQECPSGFECYPFSGDGSGEITHYQCFTYCWLYEDYDPNGLDKSKKDYPKPLPPSVTGPIPMNASKEQMRKILLGEGK